MSVPSLAFLGMDASHLDDRMDVASSPFRPFDDTDVDLDSVRDPSVIESLHDDMVDDPVEEPVEEIDYAPDPTGDLGLDDDMIDDATLPAEADQQDADYSMEAFVEHAQALEDEEILYEDDEAEPVVVLDPETPQPPQGQDQPVKYQEEETEVILDDDDLEETTSEEIRATMEPKIRSPSPASTPTQDVYQQPEALLDEATPRPVEQAEEDASAQFSEQTSPIRDSARVSEGDHTLTKLPTDAPDAAAVEGPEDQDQEAAHALEVYDNAPRNDAPTSPQQLPLEHADLTTEVGQLHPVTLNYLDEEMWLFPPTLGDTDHDASPVYFLQDASLASQPLDKLLAACRDILAGTLDHHDELVLDVSGLGLHIAEDSKHAGQITLAQILDVYLQLCRNDPAPAAPPPLYCYLTSRVSLAAQYAYLASVAPEGKTFAEVAADHLDTPEADHHLAAAAVEGDAEKQEPSHQEAVPETHLDGDDGEDLLVVEGPRETDEDEDEPAPEEYITEEISADHQGDEHDIHHVDDASPLLTADVPRDYNGRDEFGEQTLLDPQADEPFAEYADDQAQGHDHDEQSREQGDSPTHETSELTVGHEHETSSSHTLQGDGTEGDHAEIGGDADDRPHDDLFEGYEGVNDTVEPENIADYDHMGDYNDEELLIEDNDVQELTHGSLTPIEATDAPIQKPASTHGDLFVEDESFVADTDAPDLSTVVDVQEPLSKTPPPTPPKAKRKIEEDDLDFLDFNTPEPKRTRPS